MSPQFDIRTIHASLAIENNTQWRPLLAYLPVETVIRDRQEEYYRVLAEADRATNAAPFIELMLLALLDSIQEAVAGDPVTDPVSDPVAEVIRAVAKGEMGSRALMRGLGLSHRATFRKNYLDPALRGGWIERTQPDSPHSPTQRYRLTDKGRGWLQSQVEG